MIMKKYENPMLNVVSISKNDVIATSMEVNNVYNSTWTTLAPGQRGLDDWYEGY